MTSMSMATLIETAVQTRRDAEEKLAQELVRTEARAADLSDVRRLLGEAADEIDIEFKDYETDYTGEISLRCFRLRPRVWKGLVSLVLFLANDRRWWIEYKINGVQYSLHDTSDTTWMRPEVGNMLADLQEQYERLRVALIADSLTQLADHASDAAVEAHKELMTLAPEREAEWGAALAAWQRRRAEREAAVAAYVQALGEWRAKYEQALAENRRVLAETQRLLDMEFTRYEIGLAVFYTDDDGRAYPARVNIWSLDNKAGKDGSWRVLDNGRLERRVLFNVLWVGEAVTETLMAAGDGPWRETIYVHEAGQSLYCTPWLAEAARRDIRRLMISLPAEPEPPEWVRDGLTAAERERIIEVTRGMAHVGIPF